MPVRGFDMPMPNVHPDTSHSARWLASQLQVQLSMAQARKGNDAKTFDVECLKEAYPWKGHEGVCDSAVKGNMRQLRLSCTEKKDAQTLDNMGTTAEVCIPSDDLSMSDN